MFPFLHPRVLCGNALNRFRPEGARPVLEGSAALRVLDALFGRPRGAAGTGGRQAFRGSFFLLYELFTGTLEVKLFPDDNPGILASVPWMWVFVGELGVLEDSSRIYCGSSENSCSTCLT